MDATLWIVVAVVIVIAFIAYIYRREIGLTVNGWGVKATLRAKGQEQPVPKGLPERSVRIGQDAKDARILTGDALSRENADAVPGKKAGAAGSRSVSIGRDADGSTIVTGDGHKIDKR